MSLMPSVPLPANLPPRGAPCALPDARWQPGLLSQPFHSEIFASANEASGAGLALAFARDALTPSATNHAEDTRQILWVQDRAAIRLGGRPCLAGLPHDFAHRLIHVAALTPEDALFALEEGLKCRDLACVIGEIAGNPKALGFTASRRLSLMAERHGVRLWLVRLDAARDLSSARMRWQAASARSAPPRWNPAAPGTATWHAELFRARTHQLGQWSLSDDAGTLRIACESDFDAAAAPDHVDLARATVGRSLAARVLG